MRNTLRSSVLTTIAFLFVTASGNMVFAQTAAHATLEQSLNSQYPEGTALNLLTAGVVGTIGCNVQPTSTFKVKDEKLHAPSFSDDLTTNGCAKQPIAPGTQVNLGDMKVFQRQNRVAFVVFQGQCAVADCTRHFVGSIDAEVDFEFPKGFLATAQLAQVQEVIGHVFSIVSSIDAPAQGGQDAPTVSEPTLPAIVPLKLPALYISAQVPADKLQLNADNSFSLQEGGQSYHGTFVADGNTLELNIGETSTKTNLSRQGNDLTDSSGQTWSLRQQSSGSTPGGATLQNNAVSNACPPAGTEIPFGKVMNEAFASDYVGCDITSKVEFVATGGTPNYIWDSIGGLEGKAPFRVVVPGQQPGSGPFDIPPHVFIAKDQSDVIFSFKKGDLLIIRGATLVAAKPYNEIVFLATEVRAAK